MKSKVKSSGLHGYNVDHLKESSFNFLENERYHGIAEGGRVNQNVQNGTKIEETVQKVSQKLQETTETAEQGYVRPKTSEEIAVSNERVTSGRYGPKRYITTCYFQPKQIPVWYSETMILNIGSTKKKYFESIYYENKLSAFHWSETMTTTIPDNEEPTLIKSNVDIPIEKPEFHYISLEPQQQIAATTA